MLRCGAGGFQGGWGERDIYIDEIFDPKERVVPMSINCGDCYYSKFSLQPSEAFLAKCGNKNNFLGE